jgi:type IV fimbrial biogenesis protein FimT
MPRCPGFTLWELLCALLVAGVVLGLGVPSLQNTALNARRAADINAFVRSVQLARNEVAERARRVVLCKTRDLSRCGAREITYGAGWMVFVNEDGARPPQRAPQEPLLFVYRPRAGTRITSNRARFEFRPFRHFSTNGTVTFCDRRGTAAARAVIVSYTGRPRVAATGPGGRPLSCGNFP